METQRGFFADKIMDLANLGMSALVFGQIVEGELQQIPLIFGLSLLFIFGMVSFFLTRKIGRSER
jgi:hypothetical protein